NMNKFWVVLKHTYFSKLKSKSFIITTIIALLIMVGIANIDKIINLFDGDDDTVEVAVIDETDTLFEPLETSLQEVDETIQLENYQKSVDSGKQAVQDEKYDGLLVLEWNDASEPKAAYFENEAALSNTQRVLEQQLQQVKIAIATEQAGIDEETLTTIYEEVSFEKMALDKAAKTDEELSSARGIVYVMLFVLYMAVLLYGQMIATEVATEKSSRVMEI